MKREITIEYEAAIRKNGVLLKFAKCFKTEQEAENWAINNIDKNEKYAYEIIIVTREIIKKVRI